MVGKEKFKSIEKSSLERLDVTVLPKKLPNLKDKTQTKDSIIANWLKSWIEEGLKSKKISLGNLLPKKEVISSYTGVSVGTVQNAIRYIEDEGYVESKQRIGTMIKAKDDAESSLRKQSSKREKIIYLLKKYIIEQGYCPQDTLPSSRELAKKLDSTLNTTRLALEYLAAAGVITSRNSRGNKANWVLKSIPVISDSEHVQFSDSDDNKTLVSQVEFDLRDYIQNNHKVNDRLPSHSELADILKVSIKTVHDSMKALIEDGVLCARRGRYGTIVVRMPNEEAPKGIEHQIFAPAKDASFYNYQRVEKHLKLLIRKQYKLGDKLPAMGALAQELDVSSNTIRKALQNLAKQHIIEFARGRYGGTFITKMPEEKETASFKWLSVNPEHVQAYKPVEV
ncbi:MAG: GntR family transcriptional regulator [Candidatus Gastranaerophilales bacterium]|nr:GntR family transcriptional regulator [Candidatus Gastranaerophilales bacterium]